MAAPGALLAAKQPTNRHLAALQVWAASERVGCGVARCPGGEVYTVW